jgi:hypothetical protein
MPTVMTRNFEFSESVIHYVFEIQYLRCPILIRVPTQRAYPTSGLYSLYWTMSSGNNNWTRTPEISTRCE